MYKQRWNTKNVLCAIIYASPKLPSVHSCLQLLMPQISNSLSDLELEEMLHIALSSIFFWSDLRIRLHLSLEYTNEINKDCLSLFYNYSILLTCFSSFKQFSIHLKSRSALDRFVWFSGIPLLNTYLLKVMACPSF